MDGAILYVLFKIEDLSINLRKALLDSPKHKQSVKNTVHASGDCGEDRRLLLFVCVEVLRPSQPNAWDHVERDQFT